MNILATNTSDIYNSNSTLKIELKFYIILGSTNKLKLEFNNG